jgi:dephospho-CoA kinase
MKIIGITGGSGVGKSTICKMIKKNYNSHIIDTDKIGHKIIKFNNLAYEEIINEFIGFDILDDNFEIERKKLGAIVFNDKAKLQKLNNITSKYINEKILSEIQQVKDENYNYCIIDCALLLNSNLQNLCDDIFLVESDIETRINRIMKRDNISKEYALSRINSLEIKDKGNDKYKIIYNDGDLNNIKSKIKKYMEG